MTKQDPQESTEPTVDIATIQQELEDARTTLAKSQADYQNLVKRMEQERADVYFFSSQKILLAFLPAIDNLERALTTVPPDLEASEWKQGIESLYTQLQKQLEGMNVRAFTSVGEPVDENRHDVISQAPGPEHTVVQEFEKGYHMNDKIIRHAKVIV